jgi:hypothetical protein
MAFKMKGFSPFTKNGDQGPRKKNEGPVENRVYVSNNNKVGSYVSEDELESKFTKKGKSSKNYPQLSVQDYSTVKQDSKGKYVVKLKDE